MDDNDTTQRIVEQPQGPAAREQAKRLVEEGKALMEKDLRGGLAKLRQAQELDPDYPELEDEIFLREDAVEKLDNLLDYIVVLLKERKDYQACQMLKDLPANYIVQDRAQLLGDLTERIGRVEELVRLIRSPAKAEGEGGLRLYEEAINLVPDYPGLQDEYESARKHFGRYQVYLDSIEESIKTYRFDKADELIRSFREANPGDPQIVKFEVALRNKKKEARIKRNLKKKMVSVGAVAGVVLLLGLSYFGFETLQVRHADRDWTKVGRLLDQKKFAEVQSTGRGIISELGKVRVFYRGRKAELLTEVARVLGMEEVKQGAAGRVKAEGVGGYVPVVELPRLKKARQTLAEAKRLGAAGRHREAVAKYEEARGQVDGLDKGLAGRLTVEIDAGVLAQRQEIVKALIGEALNLEGKKDFGKARAGIDQAVDLTTKYNIRDPEIVAQLGSVSHRIKQESFAALVTEGDRQLKGGHDNAALAAYDRAEAFAKDNGLAAENAKTLARIQESVKANRFKEMLAKGDDSYRHSRWREAVTDYTAALAFHHQNNLAKNLPGYARLQANLAAARRAAALEDLCRAETEAGKYFSAGRWQKAKDAYANTLAMVDRSGYARDRDFAKIRGAVQARQAEVDDRLLIEAKKDYLRQRQAALFRRVFGLDSGVAFLDPQVVYLTEEKGKLTFSISAHSYENQGDGGRYTYYEVNYAFNRKTGSWTLTNKNMSSKVSNGQ